MIEMHSEIFKKLLNIILKNLLTFKGQLPKNKKKLILIHLNNKRNKV